MKSVWVPLAAVCVLVIGVYVYMARSAAWESSGWNAADDDYNLLVQGFRGGQLSLKKGVPPGLAQLTDSYDPVANAQFRGGSDRLHDLSYYKRKLYLYFGVTPALILFWPFVALTGHYLYSGQASAFFCAVGFLAEAGVLTALWRRYFSQVSVWVVAACALALGLATGVPVMLPRSSVYEVAISGGYMLTMLGLGAIWRAVHEPEQRGRWLSMASVTYGLAVGARPSLLFGAAILLMPVIQARHERRRIGALLMAAIGPILLIGLGLMLYNALRFDSPFEFGMRYQLATQRLITQRFFSPHYLWFNFRVCFLEPVHWSSHFPFVRGITVPPLPSGYGVVETPFGILTNIPVVWLALALPLAWRDRTAEARSTLGGFLSAVALIFGIGTLVICLFSSATCRYEVEFLPALLLLAVTGILGLERTLADRLAWRRTTRWGWGLLLSFSVAFNLLAGVGRFAEAYTDLGTALDQTGKLEEALVYYQQALRINPDYVDAHFNLAQLLTGMGRREEAINHYTEVLRLDPGDAMAHYNLANLLADAGRETEAISHYSAATRLAPGDARSRINLGNLFLKHAKWDDAIAAYTEALRVDPNAFEAHNNMAVALANRGDLIHAAEHFGEAARLNPTLPEVHSALAEVLERLGRHQEAQQQLAEARRLTEIAGPH